MSLIRRALHYYREEAWGIILLLVMIAVSTGSLILQVFPLAILVDYFAGLRGAGWVSRIFFHLTPDHPVAIIIGIALFYLILKLVEEVLRMFQTLLSIRIGYGALMRVRCDLFRKLQELSLAYHRSQPQGDAIYRLSWDTYGIQTVVQGFIQSVVVNSMTLIYMAVIMFANNWRLTLVALAVAPLLYWTTKLYARVLQAKATEAKEVESQLTTTIQRSAATIGLVQAFNREKDEYQRFHTNVTNSVAAYLRLHWQEVLFWLMVGVILALGASALLGYGGYLVYQDQWVLKKGDAGFTPGQLTIFFGFLMQLYGPLKNLSGSASMLATGVAGCKRVFEVLDRDPVIRDAPGAISLPKQPRVLELDRVVFRYRQGSNVLDGVSCRIHPGEMVAFVGSSGVGKTTLLNLLPRFYDPVEGAIRLDGHDLREIRLTDVRRHIALVLQENVVLPTSIRENIAYGRPDATDEQIRQAAELAGASGFIEKLEHRYEEQISESGSNLSGGQRQRISIARALLTEAPIIIMDEPTSALDPQHEQLIIETLKKIKGQRTLILVSHRLSTVADCDQIFVMESGRIVEQGRHEELVRRRGLYWTMARHQLKLQDDIPETAVGVSQTNS